MAAALLVSVVALTACGDAAASRRSQFNATDITGAAFGRELALTDAATKTPRTLASYQGQGCRVFFGYLFCPDYCPTTMTTLNAALGKMKPEDAAKVQVVFSSPWTRSATPRLLVQYVKAFNQSFAALYGSTPEWPQQRRNSRFSSRGAGEGREHLSR